MEKEIMLFMLLTFQPIPIESNICQKVRIKLLQWMFIPISLHKSFLLSFNTKMLREKKNQQNFNDLHIIKFYVEEIIEIALNRYQLILSGKWQRFQQLFPGDFKVNFYTWLVVVIRWHFRLWISCMFTNWSF